MAKRATRQYPPATLAKSLVLGKPMPHVQYRDFVTASSYVRCTQGKRGSDKGEGGDGSSLPSKGGVKRTGSRSTDSSRSGDGAGLGGETEGRWSSLPSATDVARETKALLMGTESAPCG